MKIKFVNQKTKCGCVMACIAMITGESFENIAKHFPKKLAEHHGIGLKETKFLLNLYNISYEVLEENKLIKGFVFLAAVPSLNYSNFSHQIIVDYRTFPIVYDPQKGRRGKKYYTWDRHLKYSELIKLALN